MHWLTLVFLQTTFAHQALWHPSVYGFKVDDYSPVEPLSGLSFEKWWLHGYKKDVPTTVMDLPAGQTLTLQVACNKEFTTYGSRTSDGKDPLGSCPDDVGSLHTEIVNDKSLPSSLLGCALAFADSNDINTVMPEDMVVFSVQHQCVTAREVDFAIPSSMPACSHDEFCICAWFWQGKASNNEMYMNAFKCLPSKTTGGKLIPQGQGKSKAPHYWANQGHQNVLGEIDYEHKPSYLSRDGFENGAVEGISTVGGATNSSQSASGSGQHGPAYSTQQTDTVLQTGVLAAASPSMQVITVYRERSAAASVKPSLTVLALAAALYACL